MRNRWYSLCIALSFAASLCLGACGGGDDEAWEGEKPPTENKPGGGGTEENVPGSGTVELPTYAAPDRSTVPAFPGAQGAGRYVTGGAGGKVYTVTNLNDSGEGSFRWALEKNEKRIIVFAVSGIIELKSTLRVRYGDVTVAGQTAPGDGICLKNYALRIDEGAHNTIIRFIRCRMGDEAQNEDDAMWGRGGDTPEKLLSNVIVDHCSMSWSVDECASFYRTKNFTLQWCVLSESLTESVHGKGSHGYGCIWGGAPATFHHNLLAHHSSRTPRLDGGRSIGDYEHELVDLRNNVFYNWGPGNCGYAGEGGRYNFVNNYYKPGASTNEKKNLVNRIFQPNADKGDQKNPKGLWGNFYVAGNYFDATSPDLKADYKSLLETVNKDNWEGIHPNFKATIDGKTEYIYFDYRDGNNTSQDKNKIKSTTPHVASANAEAFTETAKEAYESVLKYVGASLKRDAVDERIVEDVRNGTYKKVTTSKGSDHGLIDSQKDVDGWPVYNATAAPKDTDGDGVPDEWETTKGLNPNDKSDGSKYNLDKNYTNVEVYLNSLVEHLFPAAQLK